MAKKYIPEKGSYKFKAKLYPSSGKRGAYIYVPREIVLKLPKKEVICIIKVAR
jgi:hypothetical protein